MLRRVGLLVATPLLVASSLTIGAPRAAAQAAPPATPHRDHGKLATGLRGDAGLDGQSPSPQPNSSAAPRNANGDVHVLVSGHDTQQVQDAVQANDGSVDIAIPGKVDAHVPPDRLAALSDDPRVTFVQDSQQYHNTAGTITSEGVANSNAAPWLTAGRNGAGVNVAIIDVGGFQGYDTELGDELPPTVTKKNFCGSNPDVFDSSFTGDPHGTEVGAIIHDMAPSAGLVLICATDDPQIFEAQQYIIGLNRDGDPSNDVSIVNASWGNPIAGRGDGSGDPFTAEGIVRTLRQNNILWVASSGNEGLAHDTFSPPPGPNVYRNDFSLGAGQTVEVAVKWDSWTGPPQDFDLDILDANNNLADKYASSGLDQGAGVDPIEDAFYTNLTGSTQSLHAVIFRFAATANPRFDVYIHGVLPSHHTAVGSVTMPATSPDAFTAGATCVANNQLESYSGQGPTIDGRIVPEITGPDGTSGQDSASSDPYGAANSTCTSGFTGTSASAPHVAGAAALVKQMDPSLSAPQIQQFLEQKATDAGPAGLDNQFGFGRLNLGSVGMASGSGKPVGLLDPVTSFQGGLAISGIAFDPDSTVPSQVDVSVDGKPPTRYAALTARSDTQSSFPSVDNPFHGFAASLAVAPGPHQVCVTAINAPTSAGSNVSLGCKNGYALAGASSRTRDADFNGDNIADLAVMRPGDPAQQWYALPLAHQPLLYGDSGLGDVPVPADYDGVGHAEAAVFRPTSPAQWWIDGHSSPVIFGEPGDIPVVGDYNGDGRADIAVYRPGRPGQLFINGFPNQPLLFGEAAFGDIPVPGDYNGDGRTEFAVFRPTSPGQWYINGVPGYTQFGEPGDIPVPADYNGDGRTDIAVMRPSGPAETWYMNGVGVLNFGDSLLGDIPIPADYNGDHRANVAIDRPGSPSQWHIDGIGRIFYGEINDLPVSGR